MQQAKRFDVLDIMKGIGILLMLVGHYGINRFIQTSIYSFHMPLFFFVAGYLFHPQEISTQLRRDAKRLLIPYLVGISIYTIYLYIQNTSPSISLAIELIIWDPAGPLWFLLAFFWCKSLFNVLYQRTHKQGSQEWVLAFLVLGISLSTFALSEYVGVKLLLKISAGLVALLFYYTGYRLRAYNFFAKPNLWFALGATSIWFILATQSALQMTFVQYPWTPLAHVFISLCGTYLTFYISYYISEYCHMIKKHLLFWGQASLIVLVLHGAAYEHMMQGQFGIVKSIYTALALDLKGSSALAYLGHIILLYLGAKYIPHTRIGKAIFG